MPSMASDCARLIASVVLPSLSSAEVTCTTFTGCDRIVRCSARRTARIASAKNVPGSSIA